MSTIEKGAQILKILLNEHQVAQRMNCSVGTVRRMRLFGKGPRYRKLGGLVRYDPEDVEAWIKDQPTGGGK